MIDLAPQQTAAVESVSEWYQNGGDPLYRLFGYAGTGKTTLARYIVEALDLGESTWYAAYTGKAVSVLRSKGCWPASTVHSLIYLPRERARAHLRELERELARETARNRSHRDLARIDRLKANIRKERDRLDNPEWILRTPGESSLTGAGLLVLDEVSMVDDRMSRDLASYGVRMLCLGDPAQLPPVAGEGGALTLAEPDTLLTEVHRSALDSPVTVVATTVRQASDERGYGVTGLVTGTGPHPSGRVRDLPRESLVDFDQVLCGTNVTRWQAIRAIRRLRGFRDRYPEPGDRIMILSNSGQLDVYNGQQFEVLQVEPDGRDKLILEVYDSMGSARGIPVWKWGFTGQDGEQRARLSGRGDTAAATYAWAATVHKAQGSQWPRVLVIDESHVFARMQRGSHQDQYQAGQRWTYTGVTRASEQTILSGTGVVRP